MSAPVTMSAIEKIITKLLTNAPKSFSLELLEKFLRCVTKPKASATATNTTTTNACHLKIDFDREAVLDAALQVCRTLKITGAVKRPYYC